MVAPTTAPGGRDDTMTTSTVRPGTRIDAYDGLRAVAVVAILFYHARFAWASGAFVALTVFFTLSGFLITSLLIRVWEPGSGLGLRRFWVRRARRLLPAAWVTLIVIVTMGVAGIWDDAQRRALVVDVPASIAEIVNWVFVFQGRTYGADFASPSPVEHFWSLAVEEQLYLFIPVVLLILLRLGTRTSTVAGVGASSTIAYPSPASAHWSPPRPPRAGGGLASTSTVPTSPPSHGLARSSSAPCLPASSCASAIPNGSPAPRDRSPWWPAGSGWR